MDRTSELGNNFNHAISINERKNVLITGVKKLENFDSKEFFFREYYGIYFNKGRRFRIN